MCKHGRKAAAAGDDTIVIAGFIVPRGDMPSNIVTWAAAASAIKQRNFKS